MADIKEMIAKRVEEARLLGLEESLRENLDLIQKVRNQIQQCNISGYRNGLSKKSVPEEIEMRFDHHRINRRAFMTKYKGLKSVEKESTVEYRSFDNLMSHNVRVIRWNGNDGTPKKKIMLKDPIISHVPLVDWIPCKMHYSLERTVSMVNNNSSQGPRQDEDPLTLKATRHRQRKVSSVRVPGYDDVKIYIHYTIVDKKKFEIEVEISHIVCDVLHTKKGGAVVKKLAECIVNIFKRFYDSAEGISHVDNIVFSYGLYFNKPVLFDLKAYDNISDTYTHYMTYKLDGVRVFVILYRRCMYFMDMNNDVTKVCDVDHDYERITVLDAEYYDEKVYPFDILVSSSKSMTNLPFDKRLIELQSVVSKEPVLTPKPYQSYRSYSEFTEAFQTMYVEYKRDNTDMLIDGVIIVDGSSMYNEKRVMKWKADPTVDLYVTADSLQWGINGDRDISSYTKPTNIPDDAVNMVCEFVVSSNESLSYMRKRPDKTMPNHKDIVISTITSATKKRLTVQDLMCRTSVIYRRACNHFKRTIIDSIKGRCLDVGSGVGGDIHKYLNKKTNRTTELFCVEPDADYYKELLSRSKEYASGSTTVMCINKTMGSNEIEDDIAHIGTIDNVCFFFVINRMSLRDIRNSMKQIANVLDVNGRIHIIAMCKDKIRDWLKGLNSMDGVEYDEVVLKPDWNTDTLTMYLDSPTVGSIKENMYSTRELEDIVAGCGFVLQSERSMSPNSFMSDVYAGLMSTYVYMCFSMPEAGSQTVTEDITTIQTNSIDGITTAAHIGPSEAIDRDATTTRTNPIEDT
ncbi:hypothetical protein HDU85_005890 [Gaertneriomyces sp. JEL0708]|nr:hypothetical protein HDU85_005890 [Gaertneriomyces sp. JEL0708]